MIIYDGACDVTKTFNKWYEEKNLKYGAQITFVGVVRDDNECEGLSFDLYLPMLKNWFKKWENLDDVEIKMAHSRGDVLIGETSFLCLVATPHREKGFEYLEKFVEDFKANAPIWKYDLKNGKRVFAKQRSKKLPYAGLLK